MIRFKNIMALLRSMVIKLARSTTSSFITELPLVVDSKQDAELLSRLQAVRQLYNACLNEAMARMELLRNSDAYKAACAVIGHWSSVIGHWSLSGLLPNDLSPMTYHHSSQVLFGRAKKVRYKVPSRFKSIEGKTNKQGIRWKNNQLVWGKLRLTPIIDWENPVILHGLTSKIKYVRLLWREINGKRRWYVQLINSVIGHWSLVIGQVSNSFQSPITHDPSPL